MWEEQSHSTLVLGCAKRAEPCRNWLLPSSDHADTTAATTEAANAFAKATNRGSCPTRMLLLGCCLVAAHLEPHCWLNASLMAGRGLRCCLLACSHSRQRATHFRHLACCFLHRTKDTPKILLNLVKYCESRTSVETFQCLLHCLECCEHWLQR